MTMTQYDAIMNVAEFGDKFKSNEINMRPQTQTSITNRQWVEVVNGHMFVTKKGWDAVAAI